MIPDLALGTSILVLITFLSFLIVEELAKKSDSLESRVAQGKPVNPGEDKNNVRSLAQYQQSQKAIDAPKGNTIAEIKESISPQRAAYTKKVIGEARAERDKEWGNKFTKPPTGGWEAVKKGIKKIPYVIENGIANSPVGQVKGYFANRKSMKMLKGMKDPAKEAHVVYTVHGLSQVNPGAQYKLVNELRGRKTIDGKVVVPFALKQDHHKPESENVKSIYKQDDKIREKAGVGKKKWNSTYKSGIGHSAGGNTIERLVSEKEAKKRGFVSGHAVESGRYGMEVKTPTQRALMYGTNVNEKDIVTGNSKDNAYAREEAMERLYAKPRMPLQLISGADSDLVPGHETANEHANSHYVLHSKNTQMDHFTNSGTNKKGNRAVADSVVHFLNENYGMGSPDRYGRMKKVSQDHKEKYNHNFKEAA